MWVVTRYLTNLDEEEEEVEGIVGFEGGQRIHKSTIPMVSTFVGSSRPPPHTYSIDGFFVHRNTLGAQPSLEGTGWKNNVH